jgi:hypothetical protein
MAKADENRPTFGPQSDEESAAAAYPDASLATSRDAADYVLVERFVGPDGVRIQEQVLKSDVEEGNVEGVSLSDDNVVEAHPASERPTSDLSKAEREELDRPAPANADADGGEE